MILKFYSIAFDAFEAQEKTRGPKLFSSQRFFQNKSITFRTAFTVVPWKITIAPHPRDRPARNTLLYWLLSLASFSELQIALDFGKILKTFLKICFNLKLYLKACFLAFGHEAVKDIKTSAIITK